jgi:2-polyprenyl-3-methyl-5-hydroxy-6-metoxy-1,4-benzoquinol methylase
MKYNAKYFLCKKCGLIQVENPHWLNEAYHSPISSCDTGILERNISLSKKLAKILPLLRRDSRTIKCVDYAGGYGILTRLMRDKGYNFYWYDKYCENIFARSHESKITRHEIVTAFEFLEHLESPMNTIQQIFESYQPDLFIFSTLLYKCKPPDREWWYYSFQSGQHIAFYTLHTLRFIGSKLGFHLLSNGHNFHILSRRKQSNLIFKFISSLTK